MLMATLSMPMRQLSPLQAGPLSRLQILLAPWLGVSNARLTGRLIDPAPCIDRADLVSVCVVLRFDRPPLQVVSNSGFVVFKILERGQAGTTNPKAAWAHL